MSEILREALQNGIDKLLRDYVSTMEELRCYKDPHEIKAQQQAVENVLRSGGEKR